MRVNTWFWKIIWRICLPVAGLCLCLAGCGSAKPTESSRVAFEIPSVSWEETGAATAESETERETIPALDPETVRAEASGLIPGFEEKYYLTQLSAGELTDSCALYRGLMDFEETCKLPYGLTTEQLEKVYYLLYYECPELIQFAGEEGYTYWARGYNGLVTEVELKYTMEAEDYSLAAAQTEEKMVELCSGLEGLEPWEQEAEVYRRIVRSYTYDKTTQNCGSAYGLLVEGQAKCVGAARTAKWAFDRLGIPNYILGGASLDESVEEGHVWNAVQLSGNWYDFDSTFQFDSDEEILYPAVNVSRHWIRDQYQIHSFFLNYDLPGTETMDGSYYARQGNFVPAGASVTDLLYQRLTECYAEGGGSFALQMEEEAAYQDLVENIDTYLQEWTDQTDDAWWNAGKYWVDDYRIYRISVEVLQ